MNGFNFPPPPDEPVPVVSRDIRAQRIVPSPRKAPTVRSGKGSIFGKASIPSVYWAGDDPTPLADEEHTFYREGTPPPDEKGAAAAAAAARKRGLSLYDEERRARQQRRGRKCCGLRMWVFWLLIGLLVLVVLGVGVGVGVGVGLGAGSKASQVDGGSAARTSSATPTPTSTSSASAGASAKTVASPTASTPSSISSSASTTLATSTRASSSSSTTTTASTSPTATSGPTALCPDANNTFYSPPGSDKKFLRVCGVDYTGSEAIDMSNLVTSSMGECMDVCSKTAQCTGAGWGNVTTGEGTTELRCWLKRDLKSSRDAKAGWNFAILQ